MTVSVGTIPSHANRPLPQHRQNRGRSSPVKKLLRWQCHPPRPSHRSSAAAGHSSSDHGDYPDCCGCLLSAEGRKAPSDGQSGRSTPRAVWRRSCACGRNCSSYAGSARNGSPIMRPNSTAGRAEERPDSIADQVANDRDRRKREQWHIGARCRPDNKTRPLTASGWSSASAKATSVPQE